MPKARAQEFMDVPCREKDFEAAANGLNDAGAGHTGRTGEVIGKEGGRREGEPRGGVKNYLCHRRLKGRAGAS